MSDLPDPNVTSFSFHLLPGQKLRYPGSTHTPPRPTAYFVNITMHPITSEVIQPWLKESLLPLIGPEAVDYLEKYSASTAGQQFLDMVVRFRRTLE